MEFKKLFLIVLLIAILLTSGCVNIDVQLKLKRNDNYDLDLTISTSPEYKMILNELKKDFQVEDSVKNKFEYSETDTSITYSFKNLDPKKDKKLFKEVEKEEEITQDILGETYETPDFSFLNPENIDSKKEFKFPYYEFTYKIKTSPEKGKEQIEILSQRDYILDEANILDPNTKDQIMQRINNIYKNDSVEVIIVTKKQMEIKDYYSYQFSFIRDFEFKNKNKQYVMIFVSTNENGICKVESNIYLDVKVSSKIRTLNNDFSKNCKTDYKSQIQNVVKQLDVFFKENDLESTKQMEESLQQLFTVGYTVEVFGEITDTNGLKMGNNKVKFDVNPYKEEEYVVTFKDFFWAAILGGPYGIYLLTIGLIILGGIVFIVFSKISKKQQDMPLQVPLAVNPQLLDYVKRARMSGMTDKQIKSNLLQSGWSSKEINVALKRA